MQRRTKKQINRNIEQNFIAKYIIEIQNNELNTNTFICY